VKRLSSSSITIRFSKAAAVDFDAVVEKMAASAAEFNAEHVKQEDVARAGGAPAEAEHDPPGAAAATRARPNGARSTRGVGPV